MDERRHTILVIVEGDVLETYYSGFAPAAGDRLVVRHPLGRPERRVRPEGLRVTVESRLIQAANAGAGTVVELHCREGIETGPSLGELRTELVGCWQALDSAVMLASGVSSTYRACRQVKDQILAVLLQRGWVTEHGEPM